MDGHDDGKQAFDSVCTAHTFEVGWNALQFKLDCSGEETPARPLREPSEVLKVYRRIIASPTLARELFRLLGAGLISYTDSYGPIPHDRKGDR